MYVRGVARRRTMGIPACVYDWRDSLSLSNKIY